MDHRDWSDAVLYLAPMIPAGMRGILRNPQESTGMRKE
jgi:hypothetical protein